MTYEPNSKTFAERKKNKFKTNEKYVGLIQFNRVNNFINFINLFLKA